MFMADGQHQRLAQMCCVFIAIKSGLIGGHLEQYAARCAKINRMEIVAVNHRRDLVSGIQQLVSGSQELVAGSQ